MGVHDIYAGTSLEQALGSKKIWYVAPGTCFEVEGRQVTSTPLLALEECRGAFRQCSVGRASPPTLRRSVVRLARPGPGPSVPVPPSAVTAVAQGTSVLVSWVDTINQNATGYVVERKVAPGGYDHLANAPGAATRSYTDASPVVGSQNCYVVYSRGTAGPSGFSPEACVQVGAPPGPGGTVPLHCEGSIQSGGRIELECLPQAGRRR